jgi:hypothetical protein
VSGAAARQPRWDRPTGLQNPELRQLAQLAVKHLRARSADEEPIPADRLDWLAELIQTLANRLPQPRPETRRQQGGRRGR